MRSGFTCEGVETVAYIHIVGDVIFIMNMGRPDDDVDILVSIGNVSKF